MVNARDIVAFLAIKYLGNWDDIYKAICKKERVDEEDINEMLANSNSNYITLLDEEYPESLKAVYKPPFCLFYYGDKSLLKRPLISVIGSRTSSDYGEEATKAIIKGLVKKNYVIVSGLAKGIDSVAHRASIDNGGRTIAVLGSGIDNCYPKNNSSLYEEIKTHHLLISEYPTLTPPNKENFPIRNRIIASLGEKIIVTEAYQKSGTLITINIGLQLNKDIYCVPYPITSHSLNNHLIKEGASLIEDAEDL